MLTRSVCTFSFCAFNPFLTFSIMMRHANRAISLFISISRRRVCAHQNRYLSSCRMQYDRCYRATNQRLNVPHWKRSDKTPTIRWDNECAVECDEKSINYKCVSSQSKQRRLWVCYITTRRLHNIHDKRTNERNGAGERKKNAASAQQPALICFLSSFAKISFESLGFWISGMELKEIKTRRK